MTFIFATHNSNKVKEALKILDQSEIKIQSLSDIGYKHDIEETGTTLEENARIKARTIYTIYKKNVIAEDTGLEVTALNMAPGVYSARYAGSNKNSNENMDLLLKNMSNTDHREAQFRTVLVLYLNDKEYLFEGIVKGNISNEKLGEGGFGYDPIFIPDGYDQSFGQLSSEIKNTISHRAKAFEALKEFLNVQL
jgi:XTP/dITP diphosphohydrolase